ncbi:unnamed protein product [Schistocephalus solidus]|uniref:Uncharacterized protein n=1 Tax=Schistocephalus solidus TaxID=70667 RepID=A0A183SHL3_SCHSO|nr:unnamed protein product [Schistocephalus solidus]
MLSVGVTELDMAVFVPDLRPPLPGSTVPVGLSPASGLLDSVITSGSGGGGPLPPSCLPEQPIGAQILCLTGVSRRYLGEALTKQLEARLSSSVSEHTPLLSRHPLALFHRRCMDKSPGPASSSLPIFSLAPPPMTLNNLLSILSPNHPQMPTAVAEITLRRHLLGLQAC